MTGLTDEELIGQCASGDRKAMDLLVERYHGKLIDFAYRHLGNREAAADVAQKTLIKAFQSAGSYRRSASFKTWLYTIVLNLVRDEGRRKKTRRESLSCELESAGEKPAEEASTEETALERLISSEIWDMLECLPEKQKTAMILRFKHDLTYEEVAAVMRVPSGTVRSWVHHALKSLRRSLKPLECEK